MDSNFKRILKIDLSSKKYELSNLKSEIYDKYIGGKGIASYLLLKENPEGINPLSKENRLIIAIGPGVGTTLWGANRYAIFTKSPLTNLYSESYSGGNAFKSISKTGFDAIIIKGKLNEFGYIVINDKEVKFIEDKSLKGKDAFETEKILEEKYEKYNASAITIGVAGENLVKFAYVNNDFGRSIGRTGIGAVFGSKNLKAIVFYGNRKKEVFSEELLKEFNLKLLKIGKENSVFKNYRKYGTSLTVNFTNNANSFPTQYWKKGKLEFVEKINGDALLKELNVKPYSCGYCFIGCTRKSEVKSGRHKGLKLDGPEYETINAFGGLNLVNDIREIAYLNDLCDKLGIDTISAGNLTAFAIEAYKRGKSEFRIDYGDVDRIAELLNMIAYREGIGNIFAEGVRFASKELGLEDIAIHVKGLEPPGYDPRSLKGMGLSFGISDRGACHLRTTFYKPELAGIINPKAIKGKAKLLIEYENRLTLFDTIILCRFFRDIIYYDELKSILKLLLGKDFSKNELFEIGENITNLTREFNLREGLEPIKDDMIPEYFFNNPIQKDSISKDEYLQLLKDYYSLKGWNY